MRRVLHGFGCIGVSGGNADEAPWRDPRNTERDTESDQGSYSHLADTQLRQGPKTGEWSVGEIVKHLLLGERDLILPRLRRMRAGDAPLFSSSLMDETALRLGARPT